jgi:hypothetical protein
MCYSREPGQKKEYTSDKLRDDRVSKVLGPVLRKPTTHVFICGSANMAEESKASLEYISLQEVLKIIKAEGRMHVEVFGALKSSSHATTDLQEEPSVDKLQAADEITDSSSSISSETSNGNFFSDCQNQSYHAEQTELLLDDWL